MFSEHAFAIYPIVTQAVAADARVTPAKDFGHDLPAMLAAIDENTRVVFIANPNNPTGTWFGPQALEAFLAAVPERVLVVLDEAYIEYAQGDDLPNGLNYLASYPNLLVSRTFSKAYGLAALRVEAGFRQLGLDWIPSRANFIAVDVGRDAAPVYQGLLREGVIVRPIGGYGLPRHLRISIGLASENSRLLEALGKVLARG